MQAFFIIVGALTVVVLGLFILSLFLSPGVKVERSLFIPLPAAVIFPCVGRLRNWERWSPWHRRDPGMKITYGEIESGAGAGYSWESRHPRVGRGHLTITEVRPDEYIGIDMDFMGGHTSKGYFRFDTMPGGTRVTWGMHTEMGQHPLRKLMGLMMDRWVGADFEAGLKELAKEAGKK